jgi:hypothetical protein
MAKKVTFQQQMNKIVKQWEKHPLPEDFKNAEQNKHMCSVEGVVSQLDNLPSGPGTIMVATVGDDSSQIEIQTINVLKQ